MIATIVASAAEAEREVCGASSTRLKAGYPFAVHTDELGLANDGRRGIAIVTGLFASSRDAAAARDRGTAVGSVVALEGHRERDAPILQVIAVEHRSQAYPTSNATRPSCVVPACRIFVTSSEIVSQPPPLDGSPPRVPVTCDAARAYVNITDTRYHATVFPSAGPEQQLRIRQSVSVACDTATVREWPLRAGERVGEGETIASCP